MTSDYTGSSVDDLYAPRGDFLPGNRRVNGWNGGYQTYRDPTDHSVYDEDL